LPLLKFQPSYKDIYPATCFCYSTSHYQSAYNIKRYYFIFATYALSRLKSQPCCAYI